MSENQTPEPVLIDEAALALSNDHDQILAYFQELTHLDDIEQCQAILESTSWNLDQAVQSYYSGGAPEINPAPSEDLNGLNIIGTNTGFSGPSQNSIFNRIPQELIDSFSTIQPVDMMSIQTPSSEPEETLNRSKRLLVFNMEYFSTKFQLHIPDSERVAKIKELCEEKLNIPAKHMKLNGWRFKDRLINDQMQLHELNLPLENFLFIINTQSEMKSDELVQAEPSRAFELLIKIINTKRQVKIINNSKSFDSSSINFSTNDFYRLNFDSSTKFIEIRRKIALITNLYASDQEWWLYLDKSGKEETEAEMKGYNDQAAFHQLIEAQKLFPIPLTTMIEDDLSLAKMKEMLDEMSSESGSARTGASNPSGSTNVAETTSQKNSMCDATNPSSSKLLNSKMPVQATISTFKQVSKAAIRMAFVVTVKNHNGGNQAWPGSSVNIEGMPSTSHSNPFEALRDDSIEMNSLTAIKKPKMTEDNDDDAKKNISFDDDDNLDHDDEMNNIVYDDDLDDQFISEPKPKQKPLISKECQVGDEVACTSAFVDEFAERYGRLMPLFFIGSLDDAIKEALMCPAKDRKLLSIYLHSDKTVFCNIFCSKTLCDENIVNFLASNYIVWPWDITLKEHEDHFYETCSKFLGSVFVKNLKDSKDKFPLFLVVTRVRSNNEVAAIIEGSSTAEDMMHRLMQTYEMFESQRVKDERDEYTRDERERIKKEQDAAYQSSLEADKAKKQKQAEEDERMKQAAEKELELERQKLKDREIKRRECQLKLPEEPSESAPANSVSRIRFRLPSGEFIQRKFNIKDRLEAVIDFMISNDYFTDEYKLLSAWPRRDLTVEAMERTIEELKLYPQETLTLEQR